jgi:adenine-specific DNA-methyltransferase
MKAVQSTLPQFRKEVVISGNFSEENTVTLFLGDCMDLLKQIPDESATLVVTSPPYNIGKEYEEVVSLRRYYEQQRAVIRECYRILSRKGSICWETGNYVNDGTVLPLDIFLFPIFKELNLFLRNRIVWHFGHGLHATKRFSGRYETILWFTKSKDDYIFNLDPVRVPQKYPKKKYYKGSKKGELSCNPKGKNPSDVWNIPNVKANHPEKTIHPCQFPVGMIERLVLSMTNEGDLVVDPFIGVGSTAIAAIMHDRRCAGADIMEEYIEIAKERVRLAAQGQLKTRPMHKPVYQPSHLKQEIQWRL